MKGVWGDRALAVIREVDARLDGQTPLAERIKAIDAAYPFGERKYFPYKAWLKERKRYLMRFGFLPRGTNKSPLERMIDKSKSFPKLEVK